MRSPLALLRERPAPVLAPAMTPARAPVLPDAHAILGAIQVPVLLLDGADRFRYANQAAEAFLGMSVHQLEQCGLGDIVATDSPLLLLVGQVRSRGVSISDHDITIEGPRLHRAGVAIQACKLAEDDDAVVLTLQDSSAARALDRQMAFRGAARSVTGMAAILAHEVKNPLSGIRGAAQLLESSVAAAADQELTVLIRDEADRIRDLVDRMEAFGDKPFERGAVNIHRVLEHVRRLAQSGFAAHLRVTESYDPSLPPVWANRDMLIQVMLNLVKNSAESLTAGPAEGGEITLSTAFRHGMRVAVAGSTRRMDLPLVVTVRDNGPGIPEDMLPHLFEPFVTSKPAGSGLGLALVAKIVGDHGGLIEVESRPGRTEFRLCLPVMTEEDL